jgi:hypothetical protein
MPVGRLLIGGLCLKDSRKDSRSAQIFDGDGVEMGQEEVSHPSNARLNDLSAERGRSLLFLRAPGSHDHANDFTDRDPSRLSRQLVSAMASVQTFQNLGLNKRL